MSDVIVTESYLEDIADAIRDRNGTNQKYKIHEMDEAIRDLHNGLVDKWVRPSDWPDYSNVDLTDQEVIYLTYDAYNYEDSYISIRVYGDYIVQKGLIDDGEFVASGTATECSSGAVFQELLAPINNHNFICYKITPQDGAVITRFAFAQRTDANSSRVFQSPYQPCVERYCRLPNWIGAANRSANAYTWTTKFLRADTIMDASPVNLNNLYNDGWVLERCDLSTCSLANVTKMSQSFYNQFLLSECFLPHDLSDKCTELNGTFQSCYGLIFIDVSGWDTSNVTTFYNMFNGDRELIEIKGIEDFDVSSATTLAQMFYACRSLRKLNISKWVTTNKLTTLNGTFFDLYRVEELDVSGFNTENVTTFANCFSSAQKLKSIDLSDWTISNKVTALNNMFTYCRKLKTITRNKNWNTSNVTSFAEMFRECKSLIEIDLSDFNFSKATSIKSMFQDCNLLKSVKATINLSALTTAANVGAFMQNCWVFNDFDNLTITNCKYMPYFGYCNNGLTHVEIPSTVTTIPNDTFRDCYHLQVISFANHTAVPSLGNTNAILLNGNTKLKVIVPDSLYDTWIATTNWSNATIVGMTIKVSDYEASLSS